MSMYVGTHPVYVSHVKEVEDLLYFVADLQERLTKQGLNHGEQFACLLRVREKCRDLLLKMYAEDSDIMLMDDEDRRWIQKIVGFVEKVVPPRAG